jgi:molecular chaperone DnaK
MNSDNSELIRQQTEDLQNAFHAISQQLYAQQQAEPGSNGNGSGPQAPQDEIDGEEVVEGEFREI